MGHQRLWSSALLVFLAWFLANQSTSYRTRLERDEDLESLTETKGEVSSSSTETDGEVSSSLKELHSAKENSEHQQGTTTRMSSAVTKGLVFAALPLLLFGPAFFMGEFALMVQFFASFKYVLLVFVPTGLVMGLVGFENAAVVLVVNTFAMIPCAFMIEQSTDVLSEHAGPSIGALLNCTFGNLVEIIIGLGSLFTGDIAIVQGNVLGSVYSNLLIVPGCSFVASALSTKEGFFDKGGARYQFALMGAGIIGLLVPTYVHHYDHCVTKAAIVRQSRQISGILSVMYVLFVYFKMFTHKQMFDEGEAEAASFNKGASAPKQPAHSVEQSQQEGEISKDAELPADVAETKHHGEEEEEEPLLSIALCCLLLAMSTYLCSVHCDYLIEALEPVEKQYGIRRAFAAVILLPVVGNVSTIYVGLAAGLKNQANVAVEVALSSATQCILLVIPVVAFVGMAGGIDFHLAFSPFDADAILCLLIFSGFCLQDGRVTWIKGVMMLGVYCMMAMGFWSERGTFYIERDDEFVDCKRGGK